MTHGREEAGVEQTRQGRFDVPLGDQSVGADGLKEQYLLRYMLNVETRGSQSLLNVQAFTDPTAYKLKVKRPGSDESREVNVDLLDEWFTKQGYSAKDSEFDLIYVNGGNNLENLKTPDDTWKVRLIEEDFHRLMFDTEGA